MKEPNSVRAYPEFISNPQNSTISSSQSPGTNLTSKHSKKFLSKFSKRGKTRRFSGQSGATTASVASVPPSVSGSTSKINSTTVQPAIIIPSQSVGDRHKEYFPLPLEILRTILDYLEPVDLCRCEQVNSVWLALVRSLDSSTWRKHYIHHFPWAAKPSWPFYEPEPASLSTTIGNDVPAAPIPEMPDRCKCTDFGGGSSTSDNPTREPLFIQLGQPHPLETSWKDLYRVEYQWSRLWKRKSFETDQQMCMFIGRRNKHKKIIQVGGPNADFFTIRDAMEAVRAYTTVIVAPGIYDEQVKISMPVPFEIVGNGNPSNIVITAMFDCDSSSSRLANLHIKAPWFNESPIRVRSGYLQVENCILSSGEIQVSHPGCIALRYCRLEQTTLNFSKCSVSVVEHCLFLQAESHLICVEGCPKLDRGSISQFMLNYHAKWLTVCYNMGHSIRHSGYDTMAFRNYVNTFNHSKLRSCSTQCTKEGIESETTCKVPLSNESQQPAKLSEDNIELNEDDNKFNDSSNNQPSQLQTACTSDSNCGAQDSQASVAVDTKKPSPEQSSSDIEEEEDEGFEIDPFDANLPANHLHRLRSGHAFLLPDNTDLDLNALSENRILHPSAHSFATAGLEPPLNSNLHTKSSSDYRQENNSRADDNHNAAYYNYLSQFINNQQFGVGPSQGILKRFGRLDKFHQQVNDKDAARYYNSVKGPLIIGCKFLKSNGAISASSGSQVTVINCEFNQVQYAVKCFNDSKAIVCRNLIHNTRTSAIILKSGAFALVAANDIHRTEDASIDIRRNANPLVMYNKIHQSRRSGIVIMAQATGRIEHNQILNNQEQGIYILYKANPTIKYNRICFGKSTGITVNEQGRGLIEDNLIYQNRQAGVFIRRQGDPIVARNYIIDGQANGLLIAEKGAGRIFHNIIQSNSLCGISLNASQFPIINGNRISYNESHGIGFFPDSSHSQSCTAAFHELRISEERYPLELGEHASSSDSDDIDYNWIIGGGGGSASSYKEYNRGSSRRSSKVTLVEYNSIYSNKGCGVYCTDNHLAEIRCNALHGNRLHGIRLELPGLFGSVYGQPRLGNILYNGLENLRNCQQTSASEPVSTRSILFPNSKKKSGTKSDRKSCKRRTLIQISNNSMTCNGGCGIVANLTKLAAGRIVISCNGIYDNMEHGIVLGMEAEIIDNDIIGNQASAVYTEGVAILTLKRNRMQSCVSPPLHIASEKAALEASENIFFTLSSEQELVKLDIVSCKYLHPIKADPNSMENLRNLICASGHYLTTPSTINDSVYFGDGLVNLLSNTVFIMSESRSSSSNTDDQDHSNNAIHNESLPLCPSSPPHLGSWNVPQWSPIEPAPRPHMSLPGPHLTFTSSVCSYGGKGSSGTSRLCGLL